MADAATNDFPVCLLLSTHSLLERTKCLSGMGWFACFGVLRAASASEWIWNGNRNLGVERFGFGFDSVLAYAVPFFGFLD